MTLQQEPRSNYTTLQTDLSPDTTCRAPTLDVMVAWGYSKTLARRLVKEGRVFSGGYGPVGDDFIIDLLDSDEDFMALIVQKKWGMEYWCKSSANKALNLRARKLTRVEKLRLWLVRHVPGLDRDWLLPRTGSWKLGG